MTTANDLPDSDPILDRAWREHSREAPPAALDSAILAAAHRAAGSGPRTADSSIAEATRPQRWWMPLAAAATIGVVALGILQVAPPETVGVASLERPPPARPAVVGADSEAKQEADSGVTSATTGNAATGLDLGNERARSTAQATAATKQRDAIAAQAPPATFARKDTQEQAMDAKPIGKREILARAPRPEKSADATPQPFPAAAAPSALPPPSVEAKSNVAQDTNLFPKDAMAAAGTSALTEDKAPGGRAREAEGVRGEPRRQMAPAAPPMLAKTAVQQDGLGAKALEPEAWIARIRKLRSESNDAEALRELREFRRVVPDAEQRLPADLREWMATVKP